MKRKKNWDWVRKSIRSGEKRDTIVLIPVQFVATIFVREIFSRLHCCTTILSKRKKGKMKKIHQFYLYNSHWATYWILVIANGAVLVNTHQTDHAMGISQFIVFADNFPALSTLIFILVTHTHARAHAFVPLCCTSFSRIVVH